MTTAVQSTSHSSKYTIYQSSSSTSDNHNVRTPSPCTSSLLPCTRDKKTPFPLSLRISDLIEMYRSMYPALVDSSLLDCHCSSYLFIYIAVFNIKCVTCLWMKMYIIEWEWGRRYVSLEISVMSVDRANKTMENHTIFIFHISQLWRLLSSQYPIK